MAKSRPEFIPIKALPELAGVHVLTFDIEDWFHLCEIKSVRNKTDWPGLTSLVVRETLSILELLDRHGVRATFFILGWVAERHAELVREIAMRGHEIASHGYAHELVYRMSRADFRDDLQRSLDILCDVAGNGIKGYRAPSFSITNGCEWAFEVMAEMGLEYDASLFPAARGEGGYRGLENAGAHAIQMSGGERLFEIPMSVVRVAGLSIPFSGGGYLRLLPGNLLVYLSRRLGRQGIPAVVYLHPRDMTPHQPRVSMPWHRRFRSYVGLGSARAKLELLLRELRFIACEDYLWGCRGAL
ncbi:MAG: DUF3473 domain-containing protein [Planctomycetes bacterium]|nr:DUF3473 domain-containing protein [Planctomycetota bacterium]